VPSKYLIKRFKRERERKREREKERKRKILKMSGESPNIVREFKKAKRLPPGTGVRLLAACTYALSAGIAGYMVVSLPMRNEGEEKHCFTDFRRWCMRRKAEFLGIDPQRLSDREKRKD